jgi:hypothetical protein
VRADRVQGHVPARSRSLSSNAQRPHRGSSAIPEVLSGRRCDPETVCRAVRAVEALRKAAKRCKRWGSWNRRSAENLGKTALFLFATPNGVQEVAGSNPVAPTQRKARRHFRLRRAFFFSTAGEGTGCWGNKKATLPGEGRVAGSAESEIQTRMGLGGERRPRGGRPPFPWSDQPKRSGPGGRPGDVGWSCRTRDRITGVPGTARAARRGKRYRPSRGLHGGVTDGAS